MRKDRGWVRRDRRGGGGYYKRFTVFSLPLAEQKTVRSKQRISLPLPPRRHPTKEVELPRRIGSKTGGGGNESPEARWLVDRSAATEYVVLVV